jgi:hypothetical protein
MGGYHNDDAVGALTLDFLDSTTPHKENNGDENLVWIRRIIRSFSSKSQAAIFAIRE